MVQMMPTAERIGDRRQPFHDTPDDFSHCLYFVRIRIHESSSIAEAAGAPLILPYHHRMTIMLVGAFINLVRQSLNETLNQGGQPEHIVKIPF